MSSGSAVWLLHCNFYFVLKINRLLCSHFAGVNMLDAESTILNFRTNKFEDVAVHLSITPSACIKNVSPWEYLHMCIHVYAWGGVYSSTSVFWNSFLQAALRSTHGSWATKYIF